MPQQAPGLAAPLTWPPWPPRPKRCARSWRRWSTACPRVSTPVARGRSASAPSRGRPGRRRHADYLARQRQAEAEYDAAIRADIDKEPEFPIPNHQRFGSWSFGPGANDPGLR